MASFSRTKLRRTVKRDPLRSFFTPEPSNLNHRPTTDCATCDYEQTVGSVLVDVDEGAERHIGIGIDEKGNQKNKFSQAKGSLTASLNLTMNDSIDAFSFSATCAECGKRKESKERKRPPEGRERYMYTGLGGELK